MMDMKPDAEKIERQRSSIPVFLQLPIRRQERDHHIWKSLCSFWIERLNLENGLTDTIENYLHSRYHQEYTGYTHICVDTFKYEDNPENLQTILSTTVEESFENVFMDLLEHCVFLKSRSILHE